MADVTCGNCGSWADGRDTRDGYCVLCRPADVGDQDGTGYRQNWYLLGYKRGSKFAERGGDLRDASHEVDRFLQGRNLNSGEEQEFQLGFDDGYEQWSTDRATSEGRVMA